MDGISYCNSSLYLPAFWSIRTLLGWRWSDQRYHPHPHGPSHLPSCLLSLPLVIHAFPPFLQPDQPHLLPTWTYKTQKPSIDIKSTVDQDKVSKKPDQNEQY